MPNMDTREDPAFSPEEWEEIDKQDAIDGGILDAVIPTSKPPVIRDAVKISQAPCTECGSLPGRYAVMVNDHRQVRAVCQSYHCLGAAIMVALQDADATVAVVVYYSD